jgi:glutamine kinase
MEHHKSSQSARKIKAIILDVGRGHRRLDGAKSVPKGLEPVKNSQTNLHWLLNALSASAVKTSVYIGGYHLEKVVETFPELKVRFHRSWKVTGEAVALGQYDWEDNVDYLLLRADTLTIPEGISQLIAQQENIVAARCGEEQKTFAGLLILRAEKIEYFRRLAENIAMEKPNTDLPGLIKLIPDTAWLDVTGLATPVADREAVRSIIFRGKAQTLEQLSGLMRTAVVPQQLRYKENEWALDRSGTVSAIQQRFTEGLLVVRSSALAEDNLQTSGAGRFHSELDIDARDPAAISAGMDRVVASYGRDNRTVDPHDEILIQQQIENLRFSGVLLTRDPSSSAPYFVLNYDEESGRSDIVTSGAAGTVRTAYLSWEAPNDHLGSDLAPVFETARELMALTHNDALDIEFGRDHEGTLHLFQVRSMVVASSSQWMFDVDLEDIRQEALAFFRARSEPHPTLVGNGTALANMSDWNPVEMIGAASRPLALSLYQYLVGNSTWAESRACIGYRDVGPEPLIHSVGGRPYVDVRASLNSFLPDGLGEATAARWVSDCLDRLRATPVLQDKIEFDITATCLAFDWPEHAARMNLAGLEINEIETFKTLLADLTSKIVRQDICPISEELRQVQLLDSMRRKFGTDTSRTAASSAKRVQYLLDRCRKLGAGPFAVLARYGFISMTLLRSLRDVGEITADEYDQVLQAIPTVAGLFTRDLAEFSAGKLSVAYMVTEYGHLRPHSYEITALSYAQCPEMIGSAAHFAMQNQVKTGDSWEQVRTLFTVRQSSIQKRIHDLGLSFSIEHMLDFIPAAIAAREKAKFEFMKTVNDALEEIATFGGFLGFSREEMAFLTVTEIIRYAHDSMSGGTHGRLQRAVQYRRKRQQLTEALRLPDVIAREEDLLGFAQRPGKPNFVTRKSVIAPVILVDEFRDGMDLSGKIVAIRAADPGFDWIFGHPITGLVTEYGGIASHMVIRAAEFGLPAAIGCGGLIFDALVNCRAVELDCANQRIIPR